MRALPAALLVVAPGLGAADAVLPAGRYAIESYMLMPHLEQMRRMKASREACVAAGEARALFDVLAQPAMTGCVLVPDGDGPRDAGAEDVLLRLECAGTNGASGGARLRPGRVLKATLSVTMGGKNMTFSQHVNARRIGACGG
ncbi:MAG: hypothetical protein ACU85V_10230 [Gammaproteobacteria bacterium]